MKLIYSNDELYNISPFLHEFASSEFDVTQDNVHQVTYWLVEGKEDGGVPTGVYFPCDEQGNQVEID